MDTAKTTLEYAQKMYSEGKYELGTLALIDMHLDNKVSLRDQFAMAALQGIVLDPSENRNPYDNYAKVCYIMADAMLKAREEE